MMRRYHALSSRTLFIAGLWLLALDLGCVVWWTR